MKDKKIAKKIRDFCGIGYKMIFIEGCDLLIYGPPNKKQIEKLFKIRGQIPQRFKCIRYYSPTELGVIETIKRGI